MTRLNSKSFMLAACATGLLTLPLPANDSTAEMGAGGLELVRTDAVRMAREDLYISAEEVWVSYVYHNVSDEDVETLVAFPLPVFDAMPDESVDIPDPDSANFLDFEVWVDGERVEPELHQRATAYGIDVTNELMKLGIPLLPYQGGAYEGLKELETSVLADMQARGLVYLDIYDVGQGMQVHPSPVWHLRSTFAWSMVFPAHSEVRVEHRYTPAVGASSGVNYYDYELGRFETEYVDKYCIDPPFEAGVARRMQNEAVQYMFEQRIEYILLTANNWAGPIGKFRLTVDKGSADNLVSFCADGLTKTGPTTFEAQYEDYVPRNDLYVLIVQPAQILDQAGEST